MITYVINTSENRTLNSNLLFELAGYKKIHWMYAPLKEIESCAETIIADQNKLIEDTLRIAVIVDFYGYNRIRLPFEKDASKVHVDIYKPFLELYLTDYLYNKVQKRGCRVAACEVYYIQNNTDGSVTYSANKNEQIAHIFSLDRQSEAYKTLRKTPPCSPTSEDPIDIERYEAYKKELAAAAEVIKEPFTEFRLYLNEQSDIVFTAEEYCYKDSVGIDTFISATNARSTDNNSLIRHVFSTTGENSVNAAFDNLTLSLYLIREYEYDRTIPFGEHDINIAKIDTYRLKELLRESFSKIEIARAAALEDENEPRFYSLEIKSSHRMSKAADVANESADTPLENYATGKSVDAMYQTILTCASHSDEGMSEEDVAELDRLMNNYIRERHKNRAIDLDQEFEEMKNSGRLDKTLESCPTEDDYLKATRKKREELEVYLSSALDAEYVSVNFDAEKKLADKAYEKYYTAKADAKKHIVGDILLFVIMLLSMIIPYAALQCYEAPFSVLSFTLYGIAAAMFAGLLIFCYFVHLLPVMNRLHRAENEMRSAYNLCCSKREKAFFKLKHRYEKQLLDIETIRYEIRQIEQLHKTNRQLYKNVTVHREMLEAVAVVLKTMMSHLYISVDSTRRESINGEFHVDKPIMAAENKIYRIFSLERIDGLFPKEKGV